MSEIKPFYIRSIQFNTRNPNHHWEASLYRGETLFGRVCRLVKGDDDDWELGDEDQNNLEIFFESTAHESEFISYAMNSHPTFKQDEAIEEEISILLFNSYSIYQAKKSGKLDNAFIVEGETDNICMVSSEDREIAFQALAMAYGNRLVIGSNLRH